mgnify:CR=1 FL=1
MINDFHDTIKQFPRILPSIKPAELIMGYDTRIIKISK